MTDQEFVIDQLQRMGFVSDGTISSGHPRFRGESTDVYAVVGPMRVSIYRKGPGGKIERSSSYPVEEVGAIKACVRRKLGEQN
jgi:hypothetical protein